MVRVRRRLLYSGRVQGVGFRYTTDRIAQAFDLLGWVRNLEDGRVEIVVEGCESDVDLFLDAVREAMKEHIAEVIRDEPAEAGAPLERFCVVC